MPANKPLSATYWLAGAARVALRNLWAPLYILWLRLRIAVWGHWALEHAVFHCPPWLTLKILASCGVRIGAEFDFHGQLHLHGTYHMQHKLTIGQRCHIGPNVMLDLTGPIVLEDASTIALNAQILTHHDVGYSPLGHKAYPSHVAGVTIESGAFIGAGATVLAGVQVGRCSLIAAGALVLDDVPPYTVVAGIPARVIRQLDPDELGLRP